MPDIENETPATPVPEPAEQPPVPAVRAVIDRYGHRVMTSGKEE